MKRWAILLVAGALCACTSTREVYTQDGNVIYGLSCKLQSYQSCIEDVGELCGTLGYKFVNADGSPAQPPDKPTVAPSQPVQAQAAPRGNNFDSAPATAPASAAQATETATPPAGYKLQRKFFVRCQSS